MKIRLLALAVPFALAAAFTPSAHADEYLWVYARGADTLPKGALELEISDVWRRGKASGDYSFHDIRPEVEYGITDRLTLSAEVLYYSHNYSVDDPDLQPMFDTQGGAGGRFSDTQYAGYELRLKYNVLSTYKDPLGLAFALGYERRDKYRLDGADIDQDSVTITTFLQKNFLQDTLYFVLTPKLEFERRKSPDVLEEEFSLDVAAGVAYRFRPNWFAGLEFRHQSDYLSPQENGVFDPDLPKSSNFDLGDFRIGSNFQYGNYLGPTLHYSGRNWWATAGVLWQVYGGGAVNSLSRNNRNWDEHERMHVGLRLGWEL